ncbi:MAG: hypothetical protein LBU73_08000 [Helicobacteraceae bacterium]|jgi:hypothetical protein|nr:hypothetical protein [Helicobacteraceae bacterium]
MKKDKKEARKPLYDDEFGFREIEKKLDKALDLTTNEERAEALGMEYGAYIARKTRRAIPFAEVIILCKRHKISLDWLFGVEAGGKPPKEPKFPPKNSRVNMNVVENSKVNGDIIAGKKG